MAILLKERCLNLLFQFRQRCFLKYQTSEIVTTVENIPLTVRLYVSLNLAPNDNQYCPLFERLTVKMSSLDTVFRVIENHRSQCFTNPITVTGEFKSVLE